MAKTRRNQPQDPTACCERITRRKQQPQRVATTRKDELSIARLLRSLPTQKYYAYFCLFACKRKRERKKGEQKLSVCRMQPTVIRSVQSTCFVEPVRVLGLHSVIDRIACHREYVAHHFCSFTVFSCSSDPLLRHFFSSFRFLSAQSGFYEARCRQS